MRAAAEVAALLLTGVLLAAACGERAPEVVVAPPEPPVARPPPEPAPRADPPADGAAPPDVSTSEPRNAHHAICDGLDWLARAQHPDGSWGADGDPGATGLAILAFIGAGETHNSGQYKDQIKAGLRHLKEIQRDDGGFLSPDEPEQVLRNSLATLAMTEALGMTGSRLFKEPAQAAVDHAARLEPVDARTTAVLAMVAKSAAMSELGAAKTSACPPPAESDDDVHSLAAIVVRMFSDAPATPRDRAAIDRYIASMRDLGAERADPWAIWLGAIVLMNDGDANCSAWRRLVYPALVSVQVADGADEGSWPEQSGVGTSDALVATTAMRLLALESAYRHAWGEPWAR